MSTNANTGLSDTEQELLREALQRFLAHGAIFREDHRDLYDWARVQRSKLDEFAALIGLKLQWEHDSRLILAVPQSPRLLRHMKQDETLVTLSLWYDFDHAVKDEGKTPDDVAFRVSWFNEQLEAKFKNLKLPEKTRLGEILRLLERKSLVRLENTTGPLADTVIHVLPTIRFVIPFQGIEEWNKTRNRHLASAETPVEAPDDQPAESSEQSDE